MAIDDGLDWFHHPEDVSREEYQNMLVDEVKRLRDLCSKQGRILQAAFPEKSGHFFICGESGERDTMGLPDRVFICPAYGLDGFAVYGKERDYNAPGW